jgi:hypothetical protein
MAGSRSTLWMFWAGIVALLALDALALPTLLPTRADVWYEAEASVAQLVLGLLALVTGVGSFALRETLVVRDLRSGALDPNTAGGFQRVQRTLVALWSLSLVIAALGNVLAWGAARPLAAAPFLIGAAALLVVHAPRGWLFARPSGAMGA